MTASKNVIIGRLANCDKKGAIFVLREDDAAKLTRLWSSIRSAQTWEEFQRLCGEKLWQEVTTHFKKLEFSVPKSKRLFSSSDFPGFEDGDWPASPQATIKNWLPSSAHKLLKPYNTVHHGEFFEFNAGDKLKLIDTLRKEGFVCLENDAIIQKACGDS